jgi:copper chaperone CopZ
MVTTIEIAGMRAVHSVRAVFTALTAVEGIVSADVQLGSATIEHDGRASAEALRAAIALAGYEVTRVREDRRALPVRGER